MRSQRQNYACHLAPRRQQRRSDSQLTGSAARKPGSRNAIRRGRLFFRHGLGRVAPSLSLAREVYLDRREDVRLRLEPRGRHSRGSFILPRKLPAERPLNFGGFGVHGGGFSCFICVFVVLLSKSRPALLQNLVVSDPLERASNTRRPGYDTAGPLDAPS
jgi:hypothetical protein